MESSGLQLRYPLFLVESRLKESRGWPCTQTSFKSGKALYVVDLKDKEDVYYLAKRPFGNYLYKHFIYYSVSLNLAYSN